jgi:hypothetical protein
MKAPLFRRSIRNVHNVRYGREGKERKGKESGVDWSRVYSHKTGSQEDNGINDSHNPFIFPFSSNAEFLREGQIGAIGSSLIPPLRGGSHGAQRNRVPEHFGAMPFVIPLVDEGSTLLLIELAKHLEPFAVARDESGPPEECGVLSHPVRLGKDAGIVDSLLFGAAL